jgi:hypothetical protein
MPIVCRLAHTRRYEPLCALGRWDEQWGAPMCEPERAAPSAPTKSASEPPYRDEVERTYLLLYENFDTLYQHCSTSEQKRQLSDTHSAIRYTRWKVGQQLRPDENSSTTVACKDLKMANMQLTAMLKSLGDIGTFLSLAAEAARVAASLSAPSADA